MPQNPFRPLLSLAAGTGGALYGAALLLLALPALAFLAALVRRCARRACAAGRLPGISYSSDVCTCAFAALLLLGEEGRGVLAEAVCLALFAKALYILCYGALRLPRLVCAVRAKRQRAARRPPERGGGRRNCRLPRPGFRPAFPRKCAATTARGRMCRWTGTCASNHIGQALPSAARAAHRGRQAGGAGGGGPAVRLHGQGRAALGGGGVSERRDGVSSEDDGAL